MKRRVVDESVGLRLLRTLPEVRALADVVCSTETMIAYCRSSLARQFVIVTESGIIHRLRKECPGKEFICAPTFDVMQMPSDSCRYSQCKYVKLNTLEKLRDCMHRLTPRIELPSTILRQALQPIERMLVISATSSPESKSASLPFAPANHAEDEIPECASPPCFLPELENLRGVNS